MVVASPKRRARPLILRILIEIVMTIPAEGTVSWKMGVAKKEEITNKNKETKIKN